MANTFKCRLDELESSTRKAEIVFDEKILPQIVNLDLKERMLEADKVLSKKYKDWKGVWNEIIK